MKNCSRYCSLYRCCLACRRQGQPLPLRGEPGYPQLRGTRRRRESLFSISTMGTSSCAASRLGRPGRQGRAERQGDRGEWKDRTGVRHSSDARYRVIDAVSGKTIGTKRTWRDCDRLAISPDGKTLYVPHRGSAVARRRCGHGRCHQLRSRPSRDPHNHITRRRRECLSRRAEIAIVSVATPRIIKSTGSVGPFANVIRPFTINGSGSLCFVNINNLLGFEVGDLRTGKKLYGVEVQGYAPGPVTAWMPEPRRRADVRTRKSCGSPTARTMHPRLRCDRNAAQAETSIKLRGFPGWVGLQHGRQVRALLLTERSSMSRRRRSSRR